MAASITMEIENWLCLDDFLLTNSFGNSMHFRDMGSSNYGHLLVRPDERFRSTVLVLIFSYVGLDYRSVFMVG